MGSAVSKGGVIGESEIRILARVLVSAYPAGIARRVERKSRKGLLAERHTAKGSDVD